MPAHEPKASPASFLLLALGLLFSPLFFGAIHDVSALAFAAIFAMAFILYPESFLNAMAQLPRPFFASMIILLSWMILQAGLTAKDPDAAWIEMLKAAAYGILFCLVLGQSQERLHRLSGWIIAGTCFMTLYGFYETGLGHENVLWRHKEAHLGYVTGTFMNRNHFSGFLELSLGLTAAHFFREKAKGAAAMKAVTLLSILFLTAGLFASGSRSGILSFFIFLILFFIIHLRRSPASVRWGFIFASFAAVFGLMLLTGKMGFVRYFDAEEPFFIFRSERWQVWQDTLRLFLKYPWKGIGAGNFGVFFPTVQSETLVFGWQHAHNGYLELLAELGLPLFLVWGAGWGSLLISWFKACPRLYGIQKDQVLALGCGIGAFAAHGITDFNFSIPSNMFLFFFLIAYGTRLVKAL